MQPGTWIRYKPTAYKNSKVKYARVIDINGDSIRAEAAMLKWNGEENILIFARVKLSIKGSEIEVLKESEIPIEVFTLYLKTCTERRY